ncbi:carboxylesterase family protein [Streptomyces sp. BK205]|uniref:carboxylesterase/lipase family protein n=1 Tax=Streptomyces sp. BK205 TaxID=2512164 RepID=UPI0010451959|nr:carboxylesterase family protein [Streptomyces sp. BK205]TCR16019.1 para-nitrobenzyl esterase [Streptomyces sp. BK205]
MTTVVTTSHGRVRGTVVDGVHVFKGIPYGASTAGKGRFMRPAPAPEWTGDRDATTFGPASPQAPTALRPDAAPVLAALFDAPVDHPQSEDALTVNVWTGGLEGPANRPVIVHIHAGAFQFGWASWPMYDGTNLAREGDAVVVTLTYRLGVMGFLHLEEFGGQEYADSGNVGMLDIIAALSWVRENISAFGGDADNVTVIGDSAGGGAVITLMAMPEARGLFHRAFTISAGGSQGVPADQASDVTAAVLAELGIRPGDDLAPLREISASKLIRAQLAAGARLGTFTFGGSFRFGPVIDELHLMDSPLQIAMRGGAADIPLLVGSSKDEMTLLASDSAAGLSEDEVRDILGLMVGGHREAVLDTYRRGRPGATPGEIMLAVWSDSTRVNTLRVADGHVTHGTQPVFCYLFCWESPVEGGKYGATHILDSPFWFDNVDAAPITSDSPDRYVLARTMRDALLAFARTGRPGHHGLPDWPAYRLEDRPTLVIDQDFRIEKDPFGDERDVMTPVSARKLSGRGL